MELIVLFILSILIVIVLSGLISGSEAALLSTSYPEAKEILRNTKSEKNKKRLRC